MKINSFLNLGEVPLTIFNGGDKPEVPANPFILPAGSRYLYIKNDNPDLAGAVEIIGVTEE